MGALVLRPLRVSNGDGYELDDALGLTELDEARPEPRSELDLLRALAGGDAAALRDVYRRHHTPVRAFAGRLLGDHDAAEDLVHDVFVALPRAVARFRGECPFEGFLISIAANLARRHLRSSKRRRAAISRLSDEPPAQVPRPDQSASDAELSLRLMRALDELPDKLRVSFVLVQIEERDASEVAVILGVPASTVRARVRAARAQLQASRYLGSRKELA
jgi:RNA polymerase sigma factor (sigma-70 family)